MSERDLHDARILLVDDNKSGLMARKAVLEELGYRTTIAMGAQEALDQFQGGSFDLMITDYRMPQINGIQLIKQVREHKPDLPVILISGYVDALGLSEASTGANVVIQKSANEVTHLVRSVSRLLKRKPNRKPAGSQSAATKIRRQSV